MSNKLTIVGLGSGELDKLSLKAYKVIKDAKRLYLRTAKHPLVKELINEGIEFQTFDNIYDKADTFEDVYHEISKEIIEVVKQNDVVYAVPGHPMVAESTVNILIEYCNKNKIYLEIVGSESFLDAVFVALKLDPINGINIIDGLQLEQQPPSMGVGNLITQVYNQMVASEVKLSLMEYYSPEQLITVIRGAGIKDEERIEELPLYDLDRISWINYLTTVYVPPQTTEIISCNYPMDPIVNVLAKLRGNNGCPWDREQSHQSLKKYLLEETYEVLEAVDDGDMNKLCEELGDLLLQIVFHAQIAVEENEFDINDIITVITEKMIRRHPHVFGNVKAETSKDVEVNWEAIKKQEKGQSDESKASILAGVPKGMCALLIADQLQAKAARVGFDWPDYHGPLEKVEEEMNEVKAAIKEQDEKTIRSELGDLLFSVVNLSRSLKVSPEEALIGTNRKFIKRFSYIEEQSKVQGLDLQEMTLEQMDKLWVEAKQNGF